jgi:hypothetical protein
MDDHPAAASDRTKTAPAPLRHSALIRAARLAVLRSNVWPLSVVYAALYRLAAGAVVRLLRLRFPGHIEAVFLRGSLAMDVLVPALSDIDLFFILRDGVSPEEHERLKVLYRRLAALAPVLDPLPWILRWSEVAKLYCENPSLRFRVMEERQAAERVYGIDRLAELPEPTMAEAAVAQLFDLKTRLTYFNGLCLACGFDDELEARRREYLLFKLTIELARIELFLAHGLSIFQRREILRRILDAGADSGADDLLRGFVDHTDRFRLRRSFLRDHAVPAEVVEERILRWSLRLLDDFYARDDIRASPEVMVEPVRYDATRFLPTGHRVQRVPETALADYGRLKRLAVEGSMAGVDVVLEYHGLLINLGNGDAGLGNCTVVVAPSPAPTAFGT